MILELKIQKVLPAQLLSGRIIIRTMFYDGDELLFKQDVRVWYDG
jgi:hypothetical protein